MDFPRNLYIETANNEGHSPEFLTSTLGYIDNLTSKNLPVIFSLKHFSLLIGMELSDVIKIIHNRNYYYSFYLIKKKKGGYRRIVAPFKKLKLMQSWIKENILDKLEVSQHATGFIKGRSILNNAKSHENNDVILNLDLSNFFETIVERRVYGIFSSLGYSKNLAVEFAKICTAQMPKEKYDEIDPEKQEYFNKLYRLKESVLVQGAPTSPTLSNLICRRLDLRLSMLANKLGLIYSRYADDITFSGKASNLPSIELLKKIIEDENFEINWEKVGKYKKGQRQMVTGLLIDGKVRVPKSFKKEIYRHLHFCSKYGAFSHFQRICPDKAYRKEWLLGKIYFVYAIEPEEAKKMLKIANAINWEI
ncbi:MAG: RNA-directed DNA polymerase [Paludibacteraceae bacterium]|jgi:retron-type reverse transcriptase|nr:RNA-directed DNA polymerase [Paludibacteraceae bacterium]